MNRWISCRTSQTATDRANEMRRTWRMIEQGSPNDLRIDIFFDQTEAYLLDFGSRPVGGEWLDRRGS